MSRERVTVCGAGGFIGGHLVMDLLLRGYRVKAVDIKPPNTWYQFHDAAENHVLDLRDRHNCESAVGGSSIVYNLACDMGGMGFIEKNKALCMLSVLINTHLLQACKQEGVSCYFYASSACVYAADKQKDPAIEGLRESDAYPATPEDGYGWEKLFSERLCRHFLEDFGSPSPRIARFHNVYGPYGTYQGGREKAPAAICRKVIEAKLTGRHVIDIWGDGEQTRSFMFIRDCLEGVRLLMQSNFTEPLNIGSAEKVSVNRLVDIVEEVAGITCCRNYILDAPKGVAGRNSDNTLVKQVLGWEPSTSLREGMEKTYAWIYDRMTYAK